MASGKRTSKSSKEGYARYERESKWAANRKKKIMRHLKKQPNDSQASTALGHIIYRRKKPISRLWRGMRKTEAQLVASFRVPKGTALDKQRKFTTSMKDATCTST